MKRASTENWCTAIFEFHYDFTIIPRTRRKSETLFSITYKYIKESNIRVHRVSQIRDSEED